MSPHDHYDEAERLLLAASRAGQEVANLAVGDYQSVARVTATLLQQAQVHATLALAGRLLEVDSEG